MFNIFVFLAANTACYLIGSICSAIIVCKLFSLPDPRTQGSKNPGTTNVLRLAGKKYAVIVLLADMLKGLIPILVLKLLGANEILLGFACFFAVLGHIFPIFFQFNGGKGVATALGVFIGFHWLPALLIIATWLLVAAITRFSSLAAMISITLAPFYFLTVASSQACLPLFAIAILVLYKHRDNIQRLLKNEESPIKM